MSDDQQRIQVQQVQGMSIADAFANIRYGEHRGLRGELACKHLGLSKEQQPCFSAHTHACASSFSTCYGSKAFRPATHWHPNHAKDTNWPKKGGGNP